MRSTSWQMPESFQVRPSVSVYVVGQDLFQVTGEELGSRKDVAGAASTEGEEVELPSE